MKEKNKNFLNLVFYQIYPRSFYDSNGDGVGDLIGVTQKLDYLVELGVNAVWLSPCYKSPNIDNGYDISDYRDIMTEFGTLADWEVMIKEMHARGIKLIMDLVANHTSDRHFWFQEARKSRDNPYHDYYYWAEKPLTDWQSVFGGSAWEYNPPTGEYYLHSFAVEQPDLNWENPKVRKEMQDVVDFWVDKGVDGFRCDVLDFISKDFEKGRMHSGPRLHEFIHGLFGREKTKHLFTVGECQSGIEDIADICGEDRGELSCIFQFEHFTVGRRGRFEKTSYTMDEIRNILVKWQNFTSEHNLLYTLFTDNHDQQRYITRLGNDRKLRYESATMYATSFFLLRGIPFIYQGQEFGTTGSTHNSIEEYDDVETVNYYHAVKGKIPEKRLVEQLNFGSRDNGRRPMAWNGGKNYGFSQGEPWLPLYSRGEEINAEKDRKSKKSVFRYFQKLIVFRKGSEAVRQGEFRNLTPLVAEKGCFVYERTLEKERVVVVCNFETPQRLDLGKLGIEGYRAALGNYEKSKAGDGEFSPFESIVFVKSPTHV